jgi:DNA polymerase-3 subunit delta'
MLFKNIIGQHEIKERLKQTVRENRVSHAQLFFGGEGRGKLALAIAYAQFINCRDKNRFTNGDSCGVCPSCIKYNKLIHPDLHFIIPVSTNTSVKEKPTSRQFIKHYRELLLENDYFTTLNSWYEKIGIEKKQAGINVYECSEILRTLSYTSYESEYKIMIIWMVEKLNYQAAPKLLKILEEPPDKTLFLLIAEQHEQIISTIISRTQLIKIPKIEDDEIIKACIEKLHVSREEAAMVAEIANGNFTEAVHLIKQGEGRKNYFDRFVGWMRLCWTVDVPKIMAFSDEISKEGRESNKSFLQFGMTVLRNCLVMNYTGKDIVKFREEERGFLEKFSPFVNQANAGRFSEEFNTAIYHIERNVSPGMVFLDLSLTVARLIKMTPSKAVS